ncbi:MAG TPA: DUF1360 domain-containing protein [Gaiellaceae bacterium]|nr:DUF1360 domain-containing protein [Gaiellaceae bacterium]
MDERPPHEAYAAIMGTFAGGLAAAGALSRLLGRDPQCQNALDLTVLAVATFKAARTLARDDVSSFIREPFIRERDDSPGRRADRGDEEPVETGDWRQAIGELVTCSRCVGTWAAAGLTTTQVLAPRFGRLLTWSLAAAGINDFLQAGFAALGSRANELQERSG